MSRDDLRVDVTTAEGIRDELVSLGDGGDAEAMVRYMRGKFPFLGVKTPARRAACRTLFSESRAWDAPAIVAFVDGCWRLPERELQYVGSDLAGRHRGRLDAGHLPTIRRWITTRSWWDTVDSLASHTVGDLVLAHPEAVEVMDRWIDDDDIWVARTAMLHQLRYKERTDGDRLFGYVLRRSADEDFFSRKAAGWALRTYARVAPDDVADFVVRHGDRLSSLTRREATKHLG